MILEILLPCMILTLFVSLYQIFTNKKKVDTKNASVTVDFNSYERYSRFISRISKTKIPIITAQQNKSFPLSQSITSVQPLTNHVSTVFYFDYKMSKNNWYQKIIYRIKQKFLYMRAHDQKKYGKISNPAENTVSVKLKMRK